MKLVKSYHVIALLFLSQCTINNNNDISDQWTSTCAAICSDSFGTYQIKNATGTSLGSIGEGGGNDPIQFSGSFSMKNLADNSIITTQNFQAGQTVNYESYGKYSSYDKTILKLNITITPTSTGVPTTYGPFDVNMKLSTLCNSSCGISSDTFTITLP